MADTPPAPKLDSPFFWPTRMALGLLRLTARLPYRWQYGLGLALGELMYWCARSRRRVADTNLHLCFPELSEAGRRRLLRENLRATGVGLLETGTAWFTPYARLAPLVEIRGREHLDAALAQGHGAILLSFHFTSLELCGNLLGREVGMVAMYRPHPNALFDAEMRAGRERNIAQAIPRDDVRGAVRALKSGRPLWYAADQDYGRAHSIFVPFFGIPAATITATSRFARMSGAPVVPFTHRRLAQGRGLVLELHPALPGIGQGDEAADALAANRFLEDWLRRYPADYLWLHRRFKTRPEGEAPLYERAPQRRSKLSGKRLQRLLAQGRVLRRDGEREESLELANGLRLRLYYRPPGWRGLLPHAATRTSGPESRIAALGLPFVPVGQIRYCPSHHCDALLCLALPPERQPAPAQSAVDLGRLLARVHGLAVDLPPSALGYDAGGRAAILEPEACRFPAALSPEARARALAQWPDEASRAAFLAAYAEAGGTPAALSSPL